MLEEAECENRLERSSVEPILLPLKWVWRPVARAALYASARLEAKVFALSTSLEQFRLSGLCLASGRGCSARPFALFLLDNLAGGPTRMAKASKVIFEDEACPVELTANVLDLVVLEVGIVGGAILVYASAHDADRGGRPRFRRGVG